VSILPSTESIHAEGCGYEALQESEAALRRCAEERERLWRLRVAELEKALQHYTHCRHGCVNCFCTKEAKAAL